MRGGRAPQPRGLVLERLPFRVEVVQTGNGAELFYRMLDGVLIDDTGVFNDKLLEWEDYYNYDRPHGALGGQTPYERLKQKTPGVTKLRQMHS